MQTLSINSTGNLIRKQFLISNRQLKKLSTLSASKGKSEAEIVRLAIDAYDPDAMETESVPELMERANASLLAAIQSTQRTIKLLDKGLKDLGME